MAETTTAPTRGPREVFELMSRSWLANEVPSDELLAEDVVTETPFSPPGRPRRIEGRADFLAIATTGRQALPVRFEECRNVVIHQTPDPGVVVVEYELAGTVTTTGRRAASSFIAVLTVRDGRIVHWREYQNVLAMAHALGQLPELIASMERS